MAAYKLPKESELNLLARTEAIEKATVGAILVPEQVATLALDALLLIEKLILSSNKNAISDLGVAALMLYAGLEGAVLNMRINLVSLKNQTDQEKYRQLSETLLQKGKSIKELILVKVYQEINA
jgi:formiminotetrahydrofolate cyclodeaminase